MKATRAISFPVALDVRETGPSAPEVSSLKGKLRKTMARAWRWVTGVEPGLARARFLAEATDLADLERRARALEQIQDTRRALHPPL